MFGSAQNAKLDGRVIKSEAAEGGVASKSEKKTMERLLNLGVRPAQPPQPRKWWHRVLLGASLPHAPVVRMT